MINQEEEARAILQVLNGSAEKLNDYDEDLGYETKEGKSGIDLVTRADKEIQNYIIETLQERFPETGIIAEEDHGVEKKDRNFIIDPIDGTTNFSMGREYYCVSIAYQEDGETVIGGIASPEYEEGLISIAIRDEGAYCQTDYDFDQDLNEILKSESLDLSSHHKKLSESLGMIEASSIEDIEDKMSELRKGIGATYVQPGSAALELVEIARGNIDFRIDTIDLWDYVAGHLIVKEAGGKSLSEKYRSESLDRDLDFTVAAANGLMKKLEDSISNSGFFEDEER